MNGRCCQLLANPVWKDGEPAGAVLVLMDVTEQEKREELRREFTANVSHELKTPSLPSPDRGDHTGGMVKPEDIRDFAGDIYQEARRLIALVEDILRLSQLDEGRRAWAGAGGTAVPVSGGGPSAGGDSPGCRSRGGSSWNTSSGTGCPPGAG